MEVEIRPPFRPKITVAKTTAVCDAQRTCSKKPSRPADTKLPPSSPSPPRPAKLKKKSRCISTGGLQRLMRESGLRATCFGFHHGTPPKTHSRSCPAPRLNTGSTPRRTRLLKKARPDRHQPLNLQTRASTEDLSKPCSKPREATSRTAFRASEQPLPHLHPPPRLLKREEEQRRATGTTETNSFPLLSPAPSQQREGRKLTRFTVLNTPTSLLEQVLADPPPTSPIHLGSLPAGDFTAPWPLLENDHDEHRDRGDGITPVGTGAKTLKLVLYRAGRHPKPSPSKPAKTPAAGEAGEAGSGGGGRRTLKAGREESERYTEPPCHPHAK